MGLDQSKLETIVGGMKEIEGAARSGTDWVRIKAQRLPPSASLLLSLTCLPLFGSSLLVITWDPMATSLSACELLSEDHVPSPRPFKLLSLLF